MKILKPTPRFLLPIIVLGVFISLHPASVRADKPSDGITTRQAAEGVPAGSSAAAGQYADDRTRSCANPEDVNDIMVPVGDLCVDKYEASVWSAPGGGIQYGIDGALDYPCGNGATGTGQTCAAEGTLIYARSAAGVKPSTSLTWFQANIACANSGKHLLTNAEWQAAAAGTPDPGEGVPTPPGCNVNTKGRFIGASLTGANTGCLSSYGVENMAGSIWEMVADWGQYGPDNPEKGDSRSGLTTKQWPDAAYGSDGGWNVSGSSVNGYLWKELLPAAGLRWGVVDNGAEDLRNSFMNTQGPDAAYGAGGNWNMTKASVPGIGWKVGLPAAVIRGGGWDTGADAGVFAFIASFGPSHWCPSVGFRCGRYR